MELIKNKVLISLSLTIFFIGFLPAKCFSVTLLTEEEVLMLYIEQGGEIEKKEITLTENQVERIKNKLGGKLVEHRRSRHAKRIERKRKFTFYVCLKEKKKHCVAFFLEEPGEWGPIKFFIAIDSEKKVKSMRVMSYTETRGRPIVRKSFLRQFQGKSLKDRLQLNKGVIPVSGATISSKAAVFAIKKALIIYEEVFKQDNPKEVKNVQGLENQN